MRALVLIVSLGALGCSDDASSQGEPHSPCVAGEQVSCPCPGGAPAGVQICAADGKSFGACVGCSAGAGGAGWPDGGAGTGGTASAGGGSGGSTGGAGGVGGVGAAGGAGGSGAVAGAPSGPPQAKPPQPPPDGSSVVNAVAADHPDWLAASCVDTGGSNEFLFEVVRRLRKLDNRWGLNWKRGNIGDLSQDVVDYHWGEGVSENSTEVYIIDMIGGHCGPSPSAGWLDVTKATADKNEIGRWTLAGKNL